jgi:hypothetical protein
MVARGRIELPTHGFSVHCSTTELPRHIVSTDFIGLVLRTSPYFVVLPLPIKSSIFRGPQRGMLNNVRDCTKKVLLVKPAKSMLRFFPH